jgi:hypothetical protein
MYERQQEIKKLLQNMSTALYYQIKTAKVDLGKAVANAESLSALTHSFDTMSKERESAIARLDLLSAFEEARFDLFIRVLAVLVATQSPELGSRFSKLGLRIRDEFDQLATGILVSKWGDAFSSFGLQLSRLYESIAKEMISIQQS